MALMRTLGCRVEDNDVPATRLDCSTERTSILVPGECVTHGFHSFPVDAEVRTACPGR